jgi:hypothetical protein
MFCLRNNELQQEKDRLDERLKFMKELDTTKTNQLVRAWAEIDNIRSRYERVLETNKELLETNQQLQNNINDSTQERHKYKKESYRLRKQSKHLIQQQYNNDRLSISK